MVGGRVRRFLVWLLRTDSVRPYVYPYYVPFFIWGVYGSFFCYPIKIIVDVIGQLGYNLWVWTPIPATAIAMGGLILRHGGSPADELKGGMLKRDYLGLRMQLGGHVCMHVVLWVFCVTGMMGATWGQPVISVIILWAFVFGSGLLAAQCQYKLVLGRRLQRKQVDA